MGNPHLHGAELKTEHTPHHALLWQPVRENWGKSYFIRTLIKMEVLQEEKRMRRHIIHASQKDILVFLKHVPQPFWIKRFQVSAFNFHFYLNYCRTLPSYTFKKSVFGTRNQKKKFTFTVAVCQHFKSLILPFWEWFFLYTAIMPLD